MSFSSQDSGSSFHFRFVPGADSVQVWVSIAGSSEIGPARLSKADAAEVLQLLECALSLLAAGAERKPSESGSTTDSVHPEATSAFGDPPTRPLLRLVRVSERPSAETPSGRRR